MPKTARLQVYVTPAGFYDAVVAAPNQKAALTAWRAGSNLFGEKLACVETDPHWRGQALATPGEVVRKPRGDASALLARPAPPRPRPAKAKSPARPPPDPSRLDAADAAVKAAAARRDEVGAEWRSRRATLEAEARTAEREADAALEAAEAARAREAKAFACQADAAASPSNQSA